MRKKLFLIATTLFLFVNISCNDQFEEATEEQITNVQTETGDQEQEDDLPGERKKTSN